MELLTNNYFALVMAVSGALLVFCFFVFVWPWMRKMLFDSRTVMDYAKRIDDIAVIDNYGNPEFTLGDDFEGLYVAVDARDVQDEIERQKHYLESHNNDLFERVTPGQNCRLEPWRRINVYPIYSRYGSRINESEKQYKKFARAEILRLRQEKHTAIEEKAQKSYVCDYIERRVV